MKIKLTPKQETVVRFRFTDCGYVWARVSKHRLYLTEDKLGEALDILDNAVDITRDWLGDPAGRGEHLATINLYNKLKLLRYYS